MQNEPNSHQPATRDQQQINAGLAGHNWRETRDERQATNNMQNKPNLQNTQMTVSQAIARSYKHMQLCGFPPSLSTGEIAARFCEPPAMTKSDGLQGKLLTDKINKNIWVNKLTAYLFL